MGKVGGLPERPWSRAGCGGRVGYLSWELKLRNTFVHNWFFKKINTFLKMLNFFSPPYWEFLKINACMFSPENGLYLLSGYLSIWLSLHITLNKKKKQVAVSPRQVSKWWAYDAINYIGSEFKNELKLFHSNWNYLFENRHYLTRLWFKS